MGFRSARKKAGKSVLEVSEALGVSDVAIYNWETGKWKPEAGRLVKLAVLYGCTIDELMAEDEADGKE